LQYYKDYIFLIPKYRILIYPSKVRVKKSFGENLPFSTIKEIVTVKDDLYNFAKDLEFKGYRSPGKGRGRKSD